MKIVVVVFAIALYDLYNESIVDTRFLFLQGDYLSQFAKIDISIRSANLILLSKFNVDRYFASSNTIVLEV